ncbi:unnamed protein product [Dracunculus medinensis]|uniref:ornithine decarboxylase n=1 Tax=Dracunculus medinensis TaxID=318479 RepID=A0A3P7QD50_DRAME|nr:unnamed protein product [Dracunculus medinensis]
MFKLWNKYLPRIKPFYAVKCNNDAVMMKILASLGCGFDVASKAEIDEVLTTPDLLIYANPCKPQSFITYAHRQNVVLMTFDNMEELDKIAIYHPNARLLLRLAISDPTALCQLNSKFGCHPEKEARELLVAAAFRDISVVGISFHVGSGCNNPEAYCHGIHHARLLFDFGAEFGLQMNILDIGGGYPGNDNLRVSFEKIVNVINPLIDEYFPLSSGVNIIAEPGRFFACKPFSLAANVIASTKVTTNRLSVEKDEEAYMYYINDGVYGSFNCIFFDHCTPRGFPLELNEPIFPCTVWGPTCDSLDIVEKYAIFRKLNVGEWIFYKDMGAYTCSAASNFNGFQKPDRYYFISEDDW